MNDVLTWPVGRGQRTIQATEPSAHAPGTPIVAYIATSAAGGGMTGFFLGWLGKLAGDLPLSNYQPLLTVVLALAAFTVPLELTGRLSPLPERHVQVPRRWLSWRHRTLTAAAYGAMIGSGWLTRLQHASAYALAAAAILSASPATGLLLGVVYGATRGFALAATWIADRQRWSRPPWASLGPEHRLIRAVLAAGTLLVVIGAVIENGRLW